MRHIQVYIGPPYCRAKTYAGRVACCPLVVIHSKYADGTDRETNKRTDVRTPDRYIMLSAKRGQRTCMTNSSSNINKYNR